MSDSYSGDSNSAVFLVVIGGLFYLFAYILITFIWSFIFWLFFLGKLCGLEKEYPNANAVISFFLAIFSTWAIIHYFLIWMNGQ